MSVKPHSFLVRSPGGLVGLFLKLIIGKLSINGSEFVVELFIGRFCEVSVELCLADRDWLLLSSLCRRLRGPLLFLILLISLENSNCFL